MASRRLRQRQSTQRRSTQRQSTGLRAWDRGATALEYALVLSLLAGGSMVVLNALTAPAVSTLQRQAICTAQRPGLAGCQHDTAVQP